MISKKGDYSYLLDELKEFYNNYQLTMDDKIFDLNGEEQTDYEITTKLRFARTYCLAYAVVDTIDTKEIPKKSKEYIERVFGSYGMFNYFINTCLGEYRIYEDIGTGKVNYYPYQLLADFFFGLDLMKNILIDYLKIEFEKEDCKTRVK